MKTATILRSHYLWKLYAGYAALIVLSTGLVGWLVARSLEQRSLTEVDRRLHADATLLAQIAADELRDPSQPQPAVDSPLQRRLIEIGPRVGARLTVIRADGTVLADSEKNPRLMDDHSRRPEVLEAASAGLGTANRFSDTLGISMRYLALPVRGPQQELLGWVRTSLPLAVPAEQLKEVREAVVWGALIAILVALVLGYLLARRTTDPLLSMAAAADSIASGEYAQKVPIYSRDELGQLGRAFNTMSRKLSESIAAIHADRTKLGAILGSMVEGVIAVDREERIVHLNRVAGRLLDIAPEKAIGRPIWEVCRIQQVCEALSTAMRNEEVSEREVRRTGTKEQIIELRASPLESGADQPSGAVLLLDDVTSLRRLETMRRDFVGNVSHELKTPVAAIHGMVETLIDDPDAPVEVRQDFLHRINRQTERLSHLINDLLSLSRLEASGHALELEPIDVRDVVADCLDTLQQHSEERAVKMLAELPAGPMIVEGDEEALQHAVINLIDNAINYSPRGGQVEIRVLERDGEITIEIADRGIGIAPRDQERIFERFYRVDKARSRQVGGTGLGLAIVKHLVRALNGRVSVESQLGEGSIFRIHLPAVSSAAGSGSS